MERVNGYILSCHLMDIMLGGYRKGFKQLAIDFGVNTWDRLTENEKDWFNMLAIQYRQHPFFQTERNVTNLHEDNFVSPYHFICAVFHSENDMDLAGEILKPGYLVLQKLG